MRSDTSADGDGEFGIGEFEHAQGFAVEHDALGWLDGVSIGASDTGKEHGEHAEGIAQMESCELSMLRGIEELDAARCDDKERRIEVVIGADAIAGLCRATFHQAIEHGDGIWRDIGEHRGFQEGRETPFAEHGNRLKRHERSRKRGEKLGLRRHETRGCVGEIRTRPTGFQFFEVIALGAMDIEEVEGEHEIGVVFADESLDVLDAQAEVRHFERHERTNDVGIFIFAIGAVAQEQAFRRRELDFVEIPTSLIGQPDFVDVGEEILGGTEFLSDRTVGKKHVVNETKFVATASNAPVLPEHIG